MTMLGPAVLSAIGDVIAVAEVELTAAQIQTLHDHPIELAPAPR